MKTEIIKIINEDGSIYTEVHENATIADVFEALILAITETNEIMLCDKNDIEAHKLAKKIKNVLNATVDMVI